MHDNLELELTYVANDSAMKNALYFTSEAI